MQWNILNRISLLTCMIIQKGVILPEWNVNLILLCYSVLIYLSAFCFPRVFTKSYFLYYIWMEIHSYMHAPLIPRTFHSSLPTLAMFSFQKLQVSTQYLSFLENTVLCAHPVSFMNLGKQLPQERPWTSSELHVLLSEQKLWLRIQEIPTSSI